MILPGNLSVWNGTIVQQNELEKIWVVISSRFPFYTTKKGLSIIKYSYVLRPHFALVGEWISLLIQTSILGENRSTGMVFLDISVCNKPVSEQQTVWFIWQYTQRNPNSGSKGTSDHFQLLTRIKLGLKTLFKTPPQNVRTYKNKNNFYNKEKTFAR